MRETWVRSLGQEDPLEKEMATHSSILAWRIPWTEEPGGLQPMGSQRVGHDWATSLTYLEFNKYLLIITALIFLPSVLFFSTFILKVQRRQWQHTPVLLPGNSHGRRSLVGCSPWDHCKSDTTERLRFHFSLSCIGEGDRKSTRLNSSHNA